MLNEAIANSPSQHPAKEPDQYLPYLHLRRKRPQSCASVQGAPIIQVLVGGERRQRDDEVNDFVSQEPAVKEDADAAASAPVAARRPIWLLPSSERICKEPRHCVQATRQSTLGFCSKLSDAPLQRGTQQYWRSPSTV